MAVIILGHTLPSSHESVRFSPFYRANKLLGVDSGKRQNVPRLLLNLKRTFSQLTIYWQSIHKWKFQCLKTFFLIQKFIRQLFHPEMISESQKTLKFSRKVPQLVNKTWESYTGKVFNYIQGKVSIEIYKSFLTESG